VIAAAVVAITLIVVATLLLTGDEEAESGPAPAFDLPALIEGGPRVRLVSLRGRPAVVNFWASWCVPCERELPAFERVYRSVGDDVAFLGVNTKDSRRLGLELQDRAGLTYRSGFDPEGRVADRYRLIGMPTTVFVAPDGTLLERHAGPLTEQELRERLKRLFGA
jgi:cytochrome c biogenesis protein CcmG, thiol:disulfide interchange protein DsbE